MSCKGFSWVPPGRGLFLLDVENLLGGPRAHPAEVAAMLRRVASLVGQRPGDHVVVGANPALMPILAMVAPAARLLVGRGPDGADRALLLAADVQDPVGRYDRVVVGSGDHAFAPLAARLRAAGLAVEVICRPRSISWQLYRAAGDVRFLEPDDGLEPRAA